MKEVIPLTWLTKLLHYKAVLSTVLTSVIVFGVGALADPAIASFIGKHPAVDVYAVLFLHVLRVIEQSLTGSAPNVP